MRRFMTWATIFCIFATALFAGTVVAQEPTPEPTIGTPAGEGIGIAYGARRQGVISDASPREVFVFEGLSGELLRLTLDIAEGDLAPVVLIVDQNGRMVKSAEAGGSLRLDPLRLPASGVYTIIVSRFGGSLGTTSGRYQLELDRLGASADSGSALRYGDSVIGEISRGEPQIYYTFRANRGDVLTMQMQRLSGDLDPFLQVTDGTGRILIENDEIIGSGSLDAAINSMIVDASGVYVIIASRWGGEAGNSAGDFLLTLDTAANSALGTSALLAVPIEPGQTVSGTLSDERYAQFYRFEGRRDDVVSIRMSRTSDGNLDGFLAIADASLRELSSNDDAGSSQNPAIENFVLPADGIYYIIATRYERANGTTRGGYTLQMENTGSVFSSVQTGSLRLEYGTSVVGYVDDNAPETLYAFQGQQGDIITLAMSRSDGNLDPFLSLLDGSMNVLASDDDGAGQQNARIDRFTLPATGVYYVRAARFTNPDGGIPTSGTYLLVLAQRFD